jgi:hypothetical protein
MAGAIHLQLSSHGIEEGLWEIVVYKRPWIHLRSAGQKAHAWQYKCSVVNKRDRGQTKDTDCAWRVCPGSWWRGCEDEKLIM